MLRTLQPLLVACLLQLSGAVLAAQGEAQQPTDKNAGQSAPPDDRPRPPAPADTFTPSEKIGADSAVSFPVDI